LKFERSVLSQERVRGGSGSVYLLFRLLDELSPDANINFQLQVLVIKLPIVVCELLIFLLKLLNPLEKHVVLFIFWDFPLVGHLGAP
jgi:hypothetical protein